MSPVEIRPATLSDVPFMASLRGGASRESTIAGYLASHYSPSFALLDRVAFIATVLDAPAGYVAGHRTTRMECDGELQWLNVAEPFRGQGVADELVRHMLEWFRDQACHRVCVNVDPDNLAARKVYARHGAAGLNEHWMFWNLDEGS